MRAFTERILIAIVLFLVTSFLPIIVLYISRLHKMLSSQNQQNAKLLDGMHEGLIILSKEHPKKRVLFSNKPIEKFINMAIAAKKHYISAENDDHWLLSPKLF